jgi:hypothetical protein
MIGIIVGILGNKCDSPVNINSKSFPNIFPKGCKIRNQYQITLATFFCFISRPSRRSKRRKTPGPADAVGIPELSRHREPQLIQEPAMAKGQKRSNREVKKPKQAKQKSSVTVSSVFAPGPEGRDGAASGARDQKGGRNGRR